MNRQATLIAALALAFALVPSVAMADGICGDPYTPIPEIQGTGSSSPLRFENVTTEGVVTVDLQLSSEHRGFFLQDPKGDGDPATSDGVFVFHQNTWGFDVSVGDHVRVTADVDEFFGETQLENVDDVVTCGTADVQPLKIKTRDFNANPEQYEGMFLQFKGTHFVTDTFNLHRFGEVWLGTDSVIEQPTDVFPGGSAEMHALALDNMAQSVLIEDGSRFSDPDPVPFIREGGTLRVGDRTINPQGAIQFSFGTYKMTNSVDPVFTATNPRPSAPKVQGETVVASFNVLNYWTTLGGRGASTADQLAVQQDKLVSAILGLGADVVGLQEIENDHPDDVPISTLVAALNAAEGADVWARIDGFDQNIYPIVNEIIYRSDSVTPVGDAMTLVDPAFDDFRDPAATPDDQLGRRPIAQTFSAGEGTFTLIVNHFKSKSTTGATGPDLDQGDGQSGYNERRIRQAQAILDWIPDVVAQSGDPDVLVVGDFNAYLEEDPILLLETELHNLGERYVKDPYSFNFFASFAAPFIGRGALDHAFSTPVMNKQIRDVSYWAINSDEPRFLDWFDTSIVAPGPYRSSDHDPVLIGLDLNPDDHPGNGTGKGR